MRIRKGYWVRYREPWSEATRAKYRIMDRFTDAKVVGHDWLRGRRIVYLHNGKWCYREDVVRVFEREVQP